MGSKTERRQTARVALPRSILRGLTVGTTVMLLLWLVETVPLVVRSLRAGGTAESLLEISKGPLVALSGYFLVGALSGALYYGPRWHRLWRDPLDPRHPALILWAACGLHLFLRLVSVHSFLPALNASTALWALLPPLAYFVLAAELARAGAVMAGRCRRARPGLMVGAEPAILFWIQGTLWGSFALPGVFGLSRSGPGGLAPMLIGSSAAGLLALCGLWVSRWPAARRNGFRLAFGSATVFLLFLVWAMRPPAEDQKSPPPGSAMAAGAAGTPIIHLTIDTLRADRLGGYGGEQSTSPRLAALERQGATRFTTCFSQSSWTLPATAGILTGLHPVKLGTLVAPLPAWAPTVASRLLGGGYYTAAFVDNDLLTPANGFAKGFIEFHSPSERVSIQQYDLFRANRNLCALIMRPLHLHDQGIDRLLPRIIHWLEAHRQQPFYLYLHLMDPHFPYYLHEDERIGRGGGPERPEITIRWYELEAERMRRYYVLGHADQRRELLGRYEAEIRHTDNRLGRLFDVLQQLGLWDRSLLIVCADHGEEFFEHDSWGHTHSVHRELVQVPLWIKPPRSLRPPLAVVETPVQNLDIAPTILEAAGLEPGALEGTSLWPLMGGGRGEGPFAGRVITSATLYPYPRPVVLLSARRGTTAIIRRRSSEGKIESWYDLAADPGEEHPLPGFPSAADAAELHAALDALSATLDGNMDKVEGDLQEALRAMGYLQ